MNYSGSPPVWSEVDISYPPYVAQQAYEPYGSHLTLEGLGLETLPKDGTAMTTQSYASRTFDPTPPLHISEPQNAESYSDNQIMPAIPMMPPTMTRKRRAPTLRAGDWEPYKARIVELHITQRLPLREVKEKVEREFGFTAEYVFLQSRTTPASIICTDLLVKRLRQYRTRIIQWRGDNTIKADSMKAIIRKRQRRKLIEADYGEPVFRIKNQEVSSQKIDRWMKRNNVPECSLYVQDPDDLTDNTKASFNGGGPNLQNHGIRSAFALENCHSDRPESRIVDEGSRTHMSKTASGRPIGMDLTKFDQKEHTQQHDHVRSWGYDTGALASAYNENMMASRASDCRIGFKLPWAASESDEDSIGVDSDSFTWNEYSENTSEWDTSSALLSPMKHEYINRLLLSFYVVRQQFQSHAASDQEESHGSTGSSSGKRRATSSSSSDSSESRRSTKRTKKQSADNNGDGDDGGGDDEENGHQKVSSNLAQDDQQDSPNFACPFVKRYPHRYKRCYAHMLKDVTRVKFHLFRSKVHRLPIYCPTCSETFTNEDFRDEHVRAATCANKPQVKWEGITASQREQLGKRSPPTNTALENWNAIYKILFPSDTIPSSPYIETSLSEELHAFREHELSEGPSIWNEILRTRLPDHLQRYMEELQSLYNTFYPESVATIYESWNSRNQTASSLKDQPDCSSGYRQETEPLVNPVSAMVVGPSSSPSRSGSNLDNSVTDTGQKEPTPSASNQSALLTGRVLQQQDTTQHVSHPVFPLQSIQASPDSYQMPQSQSFMSMYYPANPLDVQYFYNPPGQTDHRNSQLPYESPQMSYLTSLYGLGDPLYTPCIDYHTGAGQIGVGMPQTQSQPRMPFDHSGSYQPYQVQMQPQSSYHEPVAFQTTSIHGFGDQRDAQCTSELVNIVAQPTHVPSDQSGESRDSTGSPAQNITDDCMHFPRSQVPSPHSPIPAVYSGDWAQ
jgi:hypothetical protein